MVNASPMRTDVCDVPTKTPRSDVRGVAATEAVAWLLDESGSGVSDVTVKVLLFVPVVFSVRTMSKPCEAPEASEPAVQTMTVAMVHGPGTVTTVVPSGMVSVPFAFCAAIGPALPIVAVKVTLEPTGEEIFDDCRAAGRAAVGALTTLVSALGVLLEILVW